MKLLKVIKKILLLQDLTLSEEDALRAQIFGCWSVPLGLPYDKTYLLELKLTIKKRWNNYEI